MKADCICHLIYIHRTLAKPVISKIVIKCIGSTRTEYSFIVMQHLYIVMIEHVTLLHLCCINITGRFN